MLAAFNGFLTGLEEVIRNDMDAGETLIVAEDFNVKSSSWGSSITDVKGEALEALRLAPVFGHVTWGTSPRGVHQRD